ncbi:MAG TPA: hypothetical protein VK659_09595 [Asanoa sp.]|nr:hypothetical protein [Asanoa sp.]
MREEEVRVGAVEHDDPYIAVGVQSIEQGHQVAHQLGPDHVDGRDIEGRRHDPVRHGGVQCPV